MHLSDKCIKVCCFYFVFIIHINVDVFFHYKYRCPLISSSLYTQIMDIYVFFYTWSGDDFFLSETLFIYIFILF